MLMRTCTIHNCVYGHDIRQSVTPLPIVRMIGRFLVVSKNEWLTQRGRPNKMALNRLFVGYFWALCSVGNNLKIKHTFVCECN